MKPTKSTYNDLLKEIRQLVEQARHKVIRNINTELLLNYWSIGRLIVAKEHSEQYDETSVRNMLLDISKELTRDLGKGFSRSQLTYMRLFFLQFPTFQMSGKSGVTVSHQKGKKAAKAAGLTVSNLLSWSHYYELLKCNDEMENRFLPADRNQRKLAVRELRRQV